MTMLQIGNHFVVNAKSIKGVRLNTYMHTQFADGCMSGDVTPAVDSAHGVLKKSVKSVKCGSV